MSQQRTERYDPKPTAALLKKMTPLRPGLAIVLGSGFQYALARMEIAHEIPYGQLPGFLSVGVSGHAGKLVVGKLGGIPVLALKGRTHYYEGHDMAQITFPVRVLAEFGIRSLLLTNAAGAVNTKYKPGDLMVFQDHVNLMGFNPLRGLNIPGLPRFVDLTNAYDPALAAFLMAAAKTAKLQAHKGVYFAVSGPSYETPAEIRAFARLGADAVGMSTVPEVIVARHCGLRVAGVSCISNMGAGLSKAGLSHTDVLLTVEHQKEKIAGFIGAFCGLYAKG